MTLLARCITADRDERRRVDRLVLSERTVKSHVSNIPAKLHLHDRTQAALFALRERLVPLDQAGKEPE